MDYIRFPAEAVIFSFPRFPELSEDGAFWWRNKLLFTAFLIKF
jgi:hypothetical protein